MLIQISADEIKEAPQDVRIWICARFGALALGLVHPEAEKAYVDAVEPPAEVVAAAVAATTNAEAILDDVGFASEIGATAPPVEMSDVLKSAVALIKSKGEGELQTCLDAVGIKSVKACPPEKLADLLTEIATRS